MTASVTRLLVAAVALLLVSCATVGERCHRVCDAIEQAASS